MADPDNDLELILQSLIDAHPGPMYEHDPMCRYLIGRYALPGEGECNCSVARNLAAREAVQRLRAIIEGRG
jgi:hypothetical protein